MSSPNKRANLSFTENGTVDPAQLNALYHIVGWDRSHSRSEAKTLETLRVSRYYIAAHTTSARLVGFARVAGDPYVAQVLDVITHPDFRRQGIASTCLQGVEKHLLGAEYASVTLTDGSGLPEFYERFGFTPLDGAITRVWTKRRTSNRVAAN